MDELNEIPKYKTIVISDVHLGSKWSKSKEASSFLRKNSCELLILCGDIIDGWAIMRGKKEVWKKRHTSFIKTLLDLSHTTRIVYLRGNHDDFLDRVIPLQFLGMEIKLDMTYRSFGKKYYILHGDVFDSITTNMSWLAKLGDVGYAMLLKFNSLYNHLRVKRGLPYRSISRDIKNKVKSTLFSIDKFEREISSMAQAKGCDGVICGHIHHPEIKKVGKIDYLNSGDWVESLSALTEDWQGKWSIYIDDSEYNSDLRKKQAERE